MCLPCGSAHSCVFNTQSCLVDWGAKISLVVTLLAFLVAGASFLVSHPSLGLGFDFEVRVGAVALAIGVVSLLATIFFDRMGGRIC